MSASSVPTEPRYRGLSPRIFRGVLEVPVHHMRGGASTGIVLFDGHLPPAREPREELIRRLAGVATIVSGARWRSAR